MWLAWCCSGCHCHLPAKTVVSSSPEPELFISLESVWLLSSFLPEAKDVHVMLNWQLQLVFRL